MEQVRELLHSIFENHTLTEAIISNLRNKELSYSKVKIKPVLLKGGLYYQFTYYTGTKVYHENLNPVVAGDKAAEMMERDFKQGMFYTKEADYQVLISKRYKATILKKPASKTDVQYGHNRKKSYLLEEGKPIPFLVQLGVMNQEGKVLAKKYDKFKQINRFLELIEDVIPHLEKDRKLQIVDFGCGKSYLTFALYHYLKEVKKLDINIIGLDLKEDVIAHCNQLAGSLEYEQLRFYVGDISKYQGLEKVDMVVTLHACDTATDAALEKAVRWGADVILSVPCCQHELFSQVKNPILSPMLQHGIIKERFAALATDSVRAQILEILGYKTQIIEFIDMEHTPKNLLVRAVRRGQKENDQSHASAYLEFKQFLQIDPYLERALSDLLQPIFTKS